MLYFAVRTQKCVYGYSVSKLKNYSDIHHLLACQDLFVSVMGVTEILSIHLLDVFYHSIFWDCINNGAERLFLCWFLHAFC